MDRLQSIVGGVLDATAVRRVFGEPIERAGVTVLPVARIRGALGGGDGGARRDRSDSDGGPADVSEVGGGVLFSATPAGAFVIRGGDVRWEPATDPDRTVLLGCLVAMTALLALRSVARSRTGCEKSGASH